MPAVKENTGSFLEFSRDLLRLISPYWRSEQKVKAWAMLLTVLAVIVVGLGIAIKLSYASADMMDAIAERDLDEFYSIGIYVLGLIVAIVILGAVSVIVKGMLKIHWRRWLTEYFLDQYFEGYLYNQLELKDYQIDNPDQRLSSDIFNLCEQTLDLGTGLFRQIILLFSFSAVLWQVAGPLEFTVGTLDVYIPGYMFWVAIIYSVVMTTVTHWIGRPLTKLEFKKLAAEADFRFNLTRIRENSESIALIGGEAREKESIWRRFAVIRENWFALLKYHCRLIAFQDVLERFTQVFPLLAGMASYLQGHTTLGGLLQLQTAFRQVTGALEWFASRYQLLTVWKASVDRILTFEQALSQARQEREQANFHVVLSTQQDIKINHLLLRLPDGSSLLEDAAVELKKGKNTLVTGTSGAGKSTLFRAISRLWVWGKGELTLPESPIMFVPQRPYLPNTSLKEVLCYPAAVDDFSDETVASLMEICCLGSFVTRLDEVNNWSRVLSGGEQQRVGFIRALLAKPDWLFLDEATAALDPDTEKTLYCALSTHLPETTVVSIAHRASLRQYHDQQLVLNPQTKSMLLAALEPGKV